MPSLSHTATVDRRAFNDASGLALILHRIDKGATMLSPGSNSPSFALLPPQHPLVTTLEQLLSHVEGSATSGPVTIRTYREDIIMARLLLSQYVTRYRRPYHRMDPNT